MITANIHSLVVGGTRGLGRTLVRRFAKAGQVVSVLGRRIPPPRERVPGHVHYWAVDITNRKRLKTALDEIIAKQGKLSNLVFFQRFRGSGDAWPGEIETTLTATRHTIEILADKFHPHTEKSIVAVASVAGRAIAEEQPVGYHAAKAALIQIMRFYAVTLGSRGIRVNSVSPCTILKERSEDSYLGNKALQALYRKMIPLGRMGSADDLAGTIGFLCSPEASFITGQDIILDGGLSLRWPESLMRRLILPAGGR